MMTSRDFYNAVLSLDVNDELRDYAERALAKMDERNAKRTSKPSKRTIENLPFREKIVALLRENGPMMASDIAGRLELTTQKVSGLCVNMVKDGVISVAEAKVPKVGVRKMYSVIVEGE